MEVLAGIYRSSMSALGFSLESPSAIVQPDLKPLRVGVVIHDDTNPKSSSTSNPHSASSSLSSSSEPHKPLSSMFNVILAGGLGGVIGDTSVYPLDTIKTRQQGAPNVVKYRSMWEATKTIVKEEGIFRGVYSGYLPAFLGSLPSTMAFFATYEYTKRTLIIDHGAPETLTYLFAGFLGDFASSFIYVPSEVLKTRLQLQGQYNNPYFVSGYNYKGTLDAFQTILKMEGPGALFYGYKATLTRDLPFSALQFAFYERLRSSAGKYVGEGQNLGIGLELVTGAVAGGLAGAITTPLDVVKTRVQTQNPVTQVNLIKSNTSTAGILLNIYRTEGMRMVFSGVGPRIVWTSIQSSIMLLGYQSILKILDEGIANRDRKTIV